MKRILCYPGLKQTVFIPENDDKTYGNPWVRPNEVGLWEVVSEILRQGGSDSTQIVYLTERS